MTAAPKDDHRLLIPRWRAGAVACHWCERISDPGWQAEEPQATDNFDEYLAMWAARPSVETAAEVVQAALVSNRIFDAFAAAEHILRADSGAVPALVALAQK